ncbi:hypothetical protein [Autumnicola musiva]
MQERKLWDAYRSSYEEAINHTSTADLPGYVSLQITSKRHVIWSQK